MVTPTPRQGKREAALVGGTTFTVLSLGGGALVLLGQAAGWSGGGVRP